ncbi:MAG: competence/damage-inducible protein cinA [candidate division NC10 bacterium]|nr:competence/damage-inducible protein cinA [candidate division NC10 bacterium]
MKAEIVAVGTELLLGQIVDTNSAYMAQQLTTIGLDLHFKSTVGDNMDRIKATLRSALNRSDFIITTGGIGPTLDDLTREAVAEVAARPLVFNQRLCDQIADFFTRVGRPMGENNRKQAFIPEEAIPIENPVGTAPGFIVECGTQAIASIPGVPHEMRHFMEHAILPYLRQKMGIREIIVSRVLKLFGIGESLVDEKIKDLIEEGKNPTIGLLAHTQIGEVHVRLTAKAEHAPDAQAMNSALECRVRERLEPFIFGSDDETYEGVLTRLLHDSGLTLAVAETGYGSSIIQTLKGLAGSDRFLKLGVTLTAPAMGAALPGVPAGSLGDEAILGEAAARGLAQGVRAFAGADLGLALTGRAAREKSQDHVVQIALAHPEGIETLEQRWPHAMRFIENRTTKLALAQVRKYILERK